ncbi:MAG: 2-amino-4-hydroxy-6-hydroxymethyldihydropteridine diphosphokinase [Dongiaceae bacterium]
MAQPILIAIGANLPSPYGSPRQTCEAVLPELARHGISIVAESRWFESAPVPLSEQPWYVNGVVAVETSLSPAELLAALHEIERGFGRVRRERNEARVIDLDLIAFGDIVSQEPDSPVVPHPRLRDRAFVLLPLADIAPDWRHPATGQGLTDMIAALPVGQSIRPISDWPAPGHGRP